MTTVKNVVRLAAKLVGVLDKVDAHFNGSVTTESQRIVDGMIACFNIVENELALDYLPIVCEQTLLPNDGCIEYSALTRNPAYISSAFDVQGNCLDVKRLSDRLLVDQDICIVRYAALPE